MLQGDERQKQQTWEKQSTETGFSSRMPSLYPHSCLISEASFHSAVILVPSQSARLFQTPEKEVLELGWELLPSTP